MRNEDHLPSSPPFNPVADIGDNLKAIRQDVAAARASLEALRVYDAIARACQDAAAACARQEAAAACAR
jgi:hypothetical protein